MEVTSFLQRQIWKQKGRLLTVWYSYSLWKNAQSAFYVQIIHTKKHIQCVKAFLRGWKSTLHSIYLTEPNLDENILGPESM